MTKDEMELIADIAKRADEMNLLAFERVSLIMDLQVAHKEVGLRLNDLLNADDENFAHDIVGIQQNVDRVNKVLTNCFLPRYSK